MKKNPRPPNPVAKHSRSYNRSVIYLDKKKAHKQGNRKHKGREDSQAA
jgi:hypothetical protein